MLMPDEWCCGNTLYSVGMIDEARELAKRNLQMVRATGAKKLITACAEGYRMWKADYPKMLDIALRTWVSRSFISSSMRTRR